MDDVENSAQHKTLRLSELQVAVLRLAGKQQGDLAAAESLRTLAEPSRVRAAVLHLRRHGLLGRLEYADESMVPTRVVISAGGRRFLAQCRTGQ